MRILIFIFLGMTSLMYANAINLIEDGAKVIKGGSKFSEINTIRYSYSLSKVTTQMFTSSKMKNIRDLIELAIKENRISFSEQFKYIKTFKNLKNGDLLLLKCLKNKAWDGARIIRETTPFYRQGDDASIKTVILLSAPGRIEAKLGRPAAGETGKTLQYMIERLHKKDPITFPSNKLDDYTIMNAVEKVHYKSKTGRTEGLVSEVIDSKNINRINEILKEYDNVVALGDKAQIAVKNSKFEGKVLSSDHPSMQSLNRQYKSTKITPKERSIDRISQWVDTIK